MTQTNKETAVSRALRRNGKAHLSPKLLATKKGAEAVLEKACWQWMDDKKKWHDFAAVDALMLEEKYLDLGPKATFTTKAFSFNKTHGSNYELDFENMTQTNKSSGNVRKIKRGKPQGKKLSVPATWNVRPTPLHFQKKNK
jgi:hypothetical protein